MTPRNLLRSAVRGLARLGLDVRPTVYRCRAALPRLRARAAQTRKLAERRLLQARLLAAARLPPSPLPVIPAAAPRVAVILPTRNQAAYIGEAIASVQAQSFAGWELIIIDDGSTDNTAEMAAPFLADPRIRYLLQEPANAAAARNRGIAATTAPLIAYIDSDNVWYPGHLAAAVAALDAAPATGVVYTALIGEGVSWDGSNVLCCAYDRAALLAQNFIDANVLVHRRALLDSHGGWDEGLARLSDWDLVLRLTAEAPAKRIVAPGARYIIRPQLATTRITARVPLGPSWVRVHDKWFPPPRSTRAPRVLYVIWHFPQLSETYVETEIRQVQKWGAHVELWRQEVSTALATYGADVPIHDGPLEAAIAAVRPDVIHVHWLGIAITHQATLLASGLPVTVRLHGFDTTRDGLAGWLQATPAGGVYGYQQQLAALGLNNPRLHIMPAAFNSQLFRLGDEKDPRLVLRTSAGLPSKDLGLLFDAAARLPDFRFVLAVVTSYLVEPYIGTLQEENRRRGGAVEIRVDVPREDLGALMRQAGIYLHTAHLPGQHPAATPIGEPSSVAEALASGCYCLTRAHPALAGMIGHAGRAYADLDEAVAAIRATEAFTPDDWQRIAQTGSDLGYLRHADVVTYQKLFMEWCGYVGEG